MDLEGLVADSLALQQFVLQVGLAGRREERLEHVFVRADFVDDGTRLDDARPPDRGRYAVAALPLRILLSAEHRRTAVGPGERFRAVVGRIHDDGVVLDAQLLELREQLAHHPVVLDHAVGIDAETGVADGRRLQVREEDSPYPFV